MAPAPSEMPEALPAVTRPSFLNMDWASGRFTVQIVRFYAVGKKQGKVVRDQGVEESRMFLIAECRLRMVP